MQPPRKKKFTAWCYMSSNCGSSSPTSHNTVESSAISVTRDVYCKRHSETAALRSAIGDGPFTNMVFL